MVIMAVRVASGMEVQKLVGQMNSARGKDDEFFCLSHRGRCLRESLQQKKTLGLVKLMRKEKSIKRR
jgi:hypothetical protein